MRISVPDPDAARRDQRIRLNNALDQLGRARAAIVFLPGRRDAVVVVNGDDSHHRADINGGEIARECQPPDERSQPANVILAKIPLHPSGLRVQSLLVNVRSYISATTGELRGVAAVEPTLRLTFNVEAGGLADGASALFQATASLHGDSGQTLSLGSAAPVLKLLGFPKRGGEDDICKTPVYAEWALTDTAVERIEKLRNGGGLTIFPNLEYALISPGAAPPDWRQPERPIRATWPRQPTSIRVDAHQWTTNVLEPWQLAAAVSLVVALPAGGVTDEQRAVVARLATARQRLTAGTPDDPRPASAPPARP